MSKSLAALFGLSSYRRNCRRLHHRSRPNSSSAAQDTAVDPPNRNGRARTTTVHTPHLEQAAKQEKDA